MAYTGIAYNPVPISGNFAVLEVRKDDGKGRRGVS
jgi:hypothetical protein